MLGINADAWSSVGRATWRRAGRRHRILPCRCDEFGRVGMFVNCAGKCASIAGERCCAWKCRRMEWTRSCSRARRARFSPRTRKLVGRPVLPPAWVFQPGVAQLLSRRVGSRSRFGQRWKRTGLKVGVGRARSVGAGIAEFQIEERRYRSRNSGSTGCTKRGVHLVLWETPSIWTSARHVPGGEDEWISGVEPGWLGVRDRLAGERTQDRFPKT